MLGPMPPPPGGIETFCADLMGSTIPFQFDVTFCQSLMIRAHVGGKQRTLFWHVCRLANTFVVGVVWFAMLLFKRPHIAHFHACEGAAFYRFAAKALLARMFGAKTIFHVHAAEATWFTARSPKARGCVIRKLLNANNMVIALSEEWKEVLESIGVASGLIMVLPNCVPMPELPAGAEAGERVTVLYLGRLEKRKGIHKLIEFIERDRDRLGSCRFVLAGPRRQDWQAIADRVARSGLDELVEMPGAVIDEAKDRAYRQADIYVLQSYAEGMPIGLLEAMSYGLACITAPVGGIPQIVADGENGLLIPPGDVDALAAAVHRLVNDPKLRQSLGKRARATIAERFSWDARAIEIAELYDSLAPSPR